MSATEFGDRYYVTFRSNKGLVQQVLLGAGSVVVTEGGTRWDIVDRPRRTSFTRYDGNDLYRMEVPVIFYGDGIEGQEVEIARVNRMRDQNNGLQTVRVEGAVPIKGVTWVIDNIEWNSDFVEWDMISGVPVRVKQGATISLLQFVDDKLVITPNIPAVKQHRTVKSKGRNAKQIAKDEYGNPSLWVIIAGSNPWIKDPRTPIPDRSVNVPPRTSGKTERRTGR